MIYCNACLCKNKNTVPNNIVQTWQQRNTAGILHYLISLWVQKDLIQRWGRGESKGYMGPVFKKHTSFSKPQTTN